jgi:hypothetical protein
LILMILLFLGRRLLRGVRIMLMRRRRCWLTLPRPLAVIVLMLGQRGLGDNERGGGDEGKAADHSGPELR